MSNKFKTINHRRTVWEYDLNVDDYQAGKFTIEGKGTFDNEPFTSVQFWSTDPELDRHELMALSAMLQDVAMNMADPDV